ncbi:MerR family transcriptional regulator [Tsukamurella ocularis]|uniref:MerR family transcriptional regulator n=1 Tax=Tsukamurella ocularis TaxID=1970234 RepID=UPI0035B5AA8B|nr:DNA-binding transcriptional MerR regulator [Tsukamurella ocularis]MCS3786504.1 DNA-binding transcriptional MerR regulator [Tsukamurella ocularis]MCS3850346.1 DNA-binding transcriptional MerR regulator [Tsukamurella ocularis]
MATDDVMARVLREVDEYAEIDGAVSVETIHRLVHAGDDPPVRSIAEVADMLELSPHSIRYYERAGLIAVDRDSLGHRTYDAEAQRRLVFITRMRLSGMSMRDLQHYVELVDVGDDSVEERLEMLLEHRDTIRRRMRELTLSLAATEYKIAVYGRGGTH